MKIAHFGDVHFRPRQRHDEYRDAFQEFFDMDFGKDLEIVISGDIVHEKTHRITPEIIDVLVWWFNEMGNKAPTHVILGNHDGNLANYGRQDAISPILKALKHPNIFLYKKSGIYPSKLDERVVYHAYSPFDEEGWDKLKPQNDKINIALFHGAVEGATTDVGWAVDGEVKPDFFDGYEYALLGDIHKQQFLNKEKTIAYPGSTIQQDFGESIDKHGFLLWDIDGKKFTCEHIELENKRPFVTLDWRSKLKSLIDDAKKYPKNSRFRVYNERPISQRDIARINNELLKLSDHVVYKFDKKSIGQINESNNRNLKRDLRRPELMIKYLNKFLGSNTFTDEEWKEAGNIVKDMMASMHDDRVLRNTSWSPIKIEFSNILKYGENNVVEFDNLNGVTGVFAPNAFGKSTIVAAITFALFGRIDREINQNHTHGIVNMRKTMAEAKLYFNVGGQNYLVHRTLERKEKKSGTTAQSKVWFYELDQQLNIVEELHETKPQETNKKIQLYVGTLEDMKITSLAAQRNMEAFIKNKSTDRKAILSRFRDLSILQDLHKISADKYREYKTLVKNLKPVDFDSELNALSTEGKELSKAMENCDSMIQVLRDGLSDIEKQLSGSDGEFFTKEELEAQQDIVDELEEDILKKESDCKTVIERQKELKDKIIKVGEKKNKIPVDKIKEKLKKKHDLETKMAGLRARLRSESDKLDEKNKTVKKLDVVPCGDSFPTCKYIRDAHVEKKNLPVQKELISDLQKDIYKCESLIVDDEEYESLLKKYDDLSTKENKLIKKLNSVSLETYKARLEVSKRKLFEAKEREKYIEMRVSDEADGRKELRNKVLDIKKEISNIDAKKISIANRQGQIMNYREKLLDDKVQYESIYHDHKIYENLTFAFGKKGIPNQLLRMDLPSVNAEIHEILRGVVDFEIELEVEEESDKLEIYINYGDSRRPIELGSGMEQAVASMAIRAGLLMASSLPKPDMLILDEAFNGIDENYTEHVIRLINSLKKWFKMIMVISHKESVKDMADNLLDIIEKGKDSFISHTI